MIFNIHNGLVHECSVAEWYMYRYTWPRGGDKDFFLKYKNEEINSNGGKRQINICFLILTYEHNSSHNPHHKSLNFNLYKASYLCSACLHSPSIMAVL